MKINLSDIEVGKPVEGELYLISSDVRKTKATRPTNFLTQVFSDGKDTIETKTWNYDSDVGPEIKKVYSIIAIAGEYMGKKQLTIAEQKLCPDQTTTEYFIRFRDDVEEMYKEAMAAIETIQNKCLRDIVSLTYTIEKERILQASSAKSFHHVGAGGNLCHTLEVYHYAVAIFLAAQTTSAAPIKKDLVVAGALMHDIGKIYTYANKEATVEMTMEGSLFDHIVIGIQKVYEIVEQLFALFPDSVVSEYYAAADLLAHIIAAHHGSNESGSPVTPKFAEAFIVSTADGLSATMEYIRQANLKAQANEPFTDRVYALNNLPLVTQAYVQAAFATEETNEQ